MASEQIQFIKCDKTPDGNCLFAETIFQDRGLPEYLANTLPGGVCPKGLD